MAVSPRPRDVDGTNLNTKVTNLKTVVSSLSATSAGAKAAAQASLRQAQVELVDHYMATGRLDPDSILSTMS